MNKKEQKEVEKALERALQLIQKKNPELSNGPVRIQDIHRLPNGDYGCFLVSDGPGPERQ
jgi:hypothetical protein